LPVHPYVAFPAGSGCQGAGFEIAGAP
jgi:hypothetical protein